MQKEEVLQLRNTVQHFIRSFGLLEQTTTPCGFSMSVSQVFALQELEEQSLTNTELSEKLKLERSSVSRLIDGLVRGGFVSREINKNNRREVVLGLTEKGQNSIRSVRDQSIWFYNKILENMSESAQTMLSESLKLFTDSLIKVRRESSESSPRS